MVTIVGLALLLVGGAALVVRGLRPRPLSATDSVLALSGQAPRERTSAGKARDAVLGRVAGDSRVEQWLGPLQPDLAIVRSSSEQLIATLMKRAAIVGVVWLILGSGILLPAIVGPVVSVLVAMLFIGVLVAREIQNIRIEAETRRRTMTSVVQGLMTITMVGATTATPINEVAERSLHHGHGWAYELLRNAWRSGTADNKKIYEALADLATEIDSRSLHLFADSIRTGDQEALALVSLSQRSHALQNEIANHILGRAEEHKRTLQLPIAGFGIIVVLITVGVPLYYGF